MSALKKMKVFELENNYTNMRNKSKKDIEQQENRPNNCFGWLPF